MYPYNAECTWQVQVQDGKYLHLQFDTFELTELHTLTVNTLQDGEREGMDKRQQCLAASLQNNIWFIIVLFGNLDFAL